jgi:diadenosine tetraphosphate (Ap4A) HIT family hydrolase
MFAVPIMRRVPGTLYQALAIIAQTWSVPGSWQNKSTEGVSTMFSLDARLQADTTFLGRLPLCQMLLMNDSRYPWVILVPARQDAREYYHLSEADQMQMMKESVWVAEKLADQYSAKSMNVAALGNVVAQLHVHHVVRKADDPAWPGPVWGHSPAVPYSAEFLEVRVQELKNLFSSHFIDDINGDDEVENNIYW